MNDKLTYLPSYLDEPERFLIWTMDEALVLLLPLLIGVMVSFYGTGIIASIVAVTIYSRTKERIGKNLLPGVLYWYFPAAVSRFKATPPSYIKEYVG